jgi:catechol 2,3-dioxygenase-like lactoylglutathione lyase family enzyme
MIVRYSFVALTTADLARQRAFWVDQLGFEVLEETAGEFFIVDAGGLRLCVDLADGDVHVAGGKDPVIGLKVDSVHKTLAALAERGVAVPEELVSAQNRVVRGRPRPRWQGSHPHGGRLTARSERRLRRGGGE